MATDTSYFHIDYYDSCRHVVAGQLVSVQPLEQPAAGILYLDVNYSSWIAGCYTVEEFFYEQSFVDYEHRAQLQRTNTTT